MDEPLFLETFVDPDLDLVKRALTGDYQAFTDLVGNYQSRIYGLVFRIVRNHQDTEDIVQQTFLSLIEHLDKFRGESLVSTWILKIASNHALKSLQKKKKLETTDFSSEEGYADIPHPEFIAKWKNRPDILAENAEVQELLDSALEQLEEKYRLVFILRDIQELSVRETAEALQLSESNVKVRLLRARLYLREILTQKLGDEATRMFPSHDHDHD